MLGSRVMLRLFQRQEGNPTTPKKRGTMTMKAIKLVVASGFFITIFCTKSGASAKDTINMVERVDGDDEPTPYVQLNIILRVLDNYSNTDEK
jgi:hypothetical protein